MRTFLVLCLAILTGCFSYVPAGEVPLAPGTAVRTQLTEPTELRVPDNSLGDATEVTGSLLRQDPDTLVLSASSLRSRSGYSIPAEGATISLPVERVARIERRRFDLVRSALLAVAAFGLTFLLSEGASGIGGGGPDGVPNPNPSPS